MTSGVNIRSRTLRSRTVRLLAIGFLLAVQIGLLVWFASLAPAPAAGDYPGSYHLSEDYDAYVGEEVSLAAHVVDTEPVTVETGGKHDLRLELIDAPPDLREGQRVRVFAVVESDNRLRHLNSFVVPRNGRLYAYVVSLLAGLWALYRLARHWRIDADRWGLAPRSKYAGTDRGGQDDAQGVEQDA